MFSIKEIIEANASAKTFFMWFSLTPLWYIAIYLFNRGFFISNSLTTISIFCLSLSISSNIYLFFNKIFASYSKTTNKIEFTNTNDDKFFSQTIAHNLVKFLWLGFLILLFYSIKYYVGYEIKFFPFLLIYFFLLTIPFVYNFGRYIKYKIKFKNRKKL